jgi:hypothetical protein
MLLSSYIIPTNSVMTNHRPGVPCLANIPDTSFRSEAYVHGIMDGEFMEKNPMTEDFALG